MLVLTRGLHDSVVIGDGVRVRIEEIRGGKVKLSFDADKSVPIVRGELVCEHCREERNSERA